MVGDEPPTVVADIYGDDFHFRMQDLQKVIGFLTRCNERRWLSPARQKLAVRGNEDWLT